VEGLLLGVIGIEGADDPFDGGEVGFAGEDDEVVGAFVGGDLDGIGALAAELLVKGGEFLGEVLGTDVTDRDDPDGTVTGAIGVEGLDEVVGEVQSVVVISDDELVAAVIDVDGGLVGEDGFDLVADIGGGGVAEVEDLDEALATGGDRADIGIDEFGLHLGFATFRDDEDGVGGFDGGEAFEGEGAIDEADGVALGDLAGADDGELALDLGMFDDGFAGGLGEPLDDHVDVGALEAELDGIGVAGRGRVGRVGRGYGRGLGEESGEAGGEECDGEEDRAHGMERGERHGGTGFIGAGGLGHRNRRRW